mmetsp:Transcript_61519/g.68912  ORF Transcript_61519/g.68912 Transcript_61519/m.68912 type:complete len:355 (+) Transcript_61519:131-1195(+)
MTKDNNNGATGKANECHQPEKQDEEVDLNLFPTATTTSDEGKNDVNANNTTDDVRPVFSACPVSIDADVDASSDPVVVAAVKKKQKRKRPKLKAKKKDIIQDRNPRINLTVRYQKMYNQITSKSNFVIIQDDNHNPIFSAVFVCPKSGECFMSGKLLSFKDSVTTNWEFQYLPVVGNKDNAINGPYTTKVILDLVRASHFVEPRHVQIRTVREVSSPITSESKSTVTPGPIPSVQDTTTKKSKGVVKRGRWTRSEDINFQKYVDMNWYTSKKDAECAAAGSAEDNYHFRSNVNSRLGTHTEQFCGDSPYTAEDKPDIFKTLLRAIPKDSTTREKLETLKQKADADDAIGTQREN